MCRRLFVKRQPSLSASHTQIQIVYWHSHHTPWQGQGSGALVKPGALYGTSVPLTWDLKAQRPSKDTGPSPPSTLYRTSHMPTLVRVVTVALHDTRQGRDLRWQERLPHELVPGVGLRKAPGLDVARQRTAPARTSATACARRGLGKPAWPSRDQGTGTRGCSSNAFLRLTPCFPVIQGSRARP